jgi:hypothetical protein
MSIDVWATAKTKFVIEGKDPITIMSEMADAGISRLELGIRMQQEKWRAQREEFLQKQSAEAKGATPDDHAYVADELVAIGRELARDLANAGTEPSVVRTLRSRAEAFRTMVEATDRAVRLARDSRGLRLGQPSKLGDDDSVEVQYKTVYEDTKKDVGEAQIHKHA